MAKIIIELEDTPSGVVVTAKGQCPPPDKKDWTDAQKLAFLLKEAILENQNSIPIH